MATVSLSPGWFSGYDIALELSFAVVTLLVSIYAFKVFKLTENRDSKLFSISFLLLSLSYLTLSITNFLTLGTLSGKEFIQLSTLSNLLSLNQITLYIYMILFLSAVVILSFMTLGKANKKTFALIYIPLLVSLLVGSNKLYLFHILSSILLLFIVIYYYNNYSRNKNVKTLIVLISFFFLMIGRIHYVISINHIQFYTTGHILELVAYTLILFSLIRVGK